MASKEYLKICAQFLRSVGLTVEECPGASGFTPGVDIRNGALLVDPETATPSNLLHEAGHLAIVPSQYRSLFQSNVEGGQRLMYECLERDGVEPESPLYRACLQSSETEATAWAWAAGKYLGIPEDRIIEDKDYAGEGAIVRLQLQAKAYLGINGLSHAGFCSTSSLQERISGRPAYPAMSKWLHEPNLSPFSESWGA